MKEQLQQWPAPLFRRWVLTIALGFAFLGIGTAVWLALNDRVLLMLSIVMFALTLGKAVMMFRSIALRRYEVVEGVCVQISSLPFQKCKKVKLLDADGNERSVLMDKQTRLRIGGRYRLYFRIGNHTAVSDTWIRSSLAAGNLLGMEDLGDFTDFDEKIE